MKIIIINGKGGCGKDTFCDIAATRYKTMNISAITPIKEMAQIVGWNGDKSPEGRRFLAQLKSIVTEYNDGTTTYLVNMAKKFAETDNEIMFVHIREPLMIQRFKDVITTIMPDMDIKALLIKRASQKYLVYGNAADDEVENYEYDYVYNNDTDLAEYKENVLKFCEQL